VCNAGVAPFLNISGLLLVKQMWKNLLEFRLFEIMLHPTYVVQNTGLTSDDGLGWVWQCNVFGHYVLVCLLRPATFLWMLMLVLLGICFVVFSVPSVRGEACSVADGARSRRVDVLV
jgi:hypothetical protein